MMSTPELAAAGWPLPAADLFGATIFVSAPCAAAVAW